MSYFLLFVVSFVHSALPISFEPSVHFTNNFNFKWEFGNYEAEHVRTRRNADWRPVKMQMEYVDETWCAANKKLKVRYTTGIKCGEDYRLSTMFDNRPKVPIPATDNNNRYHTLIMLDPDAPSRKNPKFRSWLHWLVINIRNGDFRNGTEVMPYRPPTPPPGSGKHRYIFLVFQQEGKQKTVDALDERAKFSVNDYASKNSLSRVAGFTYFTTEAKQKRIKRLSDLSDL